MNTVITQEDVPAAHVINIFSKVKMRINNQFIIMLKVWAVLFVCVFITYSL